MERQIHVFLIIGAVFGATVAPLAAKPSPADGRSLFVTNCAACHGADATGAEGPNLRRKNLSEAFIRTAIQKGFKNEMPSFGNKLKAKEITALTVYIHSLQK